MSKSTPKKSQPASVEQAIPATPTAKQERKYPVQQLRAHCLELFGITTSTFDAVAKTLKEPAYAVDEMKSTIKAWGTAPIQPKKEAK